MPSRYGEYEIAGSRENNPRLLGSGILGKRYLTSAAGAEPGAPPRPATLKLLTVGLVHGDEARAQLVREILGLAGQPGPNVVPYLDAGVQGRELYYIAEHCRGGDLAQVARRFGALPERAVALIGLQVVTGLKEVHQRRRLIHRDIKPAGIVLSEDLEPGLNRQQLIGVLEKNDQLCRIVDFGMVNLVLNAAQTPQRFIGSLMYASPEQILEHPMDARCDIYSLGMTLWHLAQGEGPLLADSGGELRDPNELRKRQTAPEEYESRLPQTLSPGFRQILARMIAKRPEQRYLNAAEALVALQQHLKATAAAGGGVGKFPISRVEGALDTVCEVGGKISQHAGFATYSGMMRTSSRAVFVTVAGSILGAADAREIEVISRRLCRMAEVSALSGCPETIIRIRRVILSSDLLVCTEESFPQVSLAQVLKARVKVKRAIAFAEVVAVLRPISDAFDFMAQSGEDAVSLHGEDILLGGETAEAALQNPEALLTALHEWKGLRVRFSIVPMSMLSAPRVDEAVENPGGTTFGSMQMSPDDHHPVPVFARLAYRILNGSEVAAAVRLVPEAYVPAVTLTPASNNLIRDLLSQHRAWFNARAVLKELCVNEGLPWKGTGPASASASPAESQAASSGADRLPQESPSSASAPVRRAPAPEPLGQTALPPPDPARLGSSAIRTPPPARPQPVKAPPVPKKGSPILLILALFFFFSLAGLGAAGWWLYTHRSSGLAAILNAVSSPKPDPFAGLAAGDSKVIGGVAFRWCPPTGAAGFKMGSPEDEPGRGKDEALHSVVLSQGFWLAETELTQGQWRDVQGRSLREQMEKILADTTPHVIGGKMQALKDFLHLSSPDPSRALGVEGPGMPMYWVSWQDADAFCRALTQREHAAATLPAGWEVQLPTEAQWEYACRAGTAEATFAGPMHILGRNNAPILDPIAWYGGNGGVDYVGRGWDYSKVAEKQHPYTRSGPRAVGQKRANPWELIDMLGNVSEWCRDWYAPYGPAAVADPEGPAASSGFHVYRGGAWSSVASACRAARRFHGEPEFLSNALGCRPAIVAVKTR